METIRYESTNRKSGEVSFRQALLMGQAPDRGLFTPTSVPKIALDELESMRNKDYAGVAFDVARRFLAGEVPERELERICRESYNFEVPLEKAFGRLYVMRLDRGPTAAFKDFAARMMARLMSYFIGREGGKLLILTATSGDTGSAVANAFHNVKNITVVVLFPKNEVTSRQRKQMTTLGGNVTTVAVDGKFDDCQHLVKTAFADKDLSRLSLSSANSINFGRLLPQSVYYVYSYVKLYEKPGERIVFSVPSGNFGDLMGGVLAFRMGLPVERFVVATNENDEFPNFMKTGEYTPIRPSKACISNAMNVGHPSNLARLFRMYGGWMDETGVVHEKPDMKALRRDLYAVSVSDAQTRDAIKTAYNRCKLVLEPHGAVGWCGLEKYLKESGWEGLSVTLETADPAKFPEEIVKTLGFEPHVPESLKGLEGRIEHVEELGADYSSLKNFLQKRFS